MLLSRLEHIQRQILMQMTTTLAVTHIKLNTRATVSHRTFSFFSCHYNDIYATVFVANKTNIIII